jgi:hypothetical protein
MVKKYIFFCVFYNDEKCGEKVMEGKERRKRTAAPVRLIEKTSHSKEL